MNAARLNNSVCLLHHYRVRHKQAAFSSYIVKKLTRLLVLRDRFTFSHEPLCKIFTKFDPFRRFPIREGALFSTVSFSKEGDSIELQLLWIMQRFPQKKRIKLEKLIHNLSSRAVKSAFSDVVQKDEFSRVRPWTLARNLVFTHFCRTNKSRVKN